MQRLMAAAILLALAGAGPAVAGVVPNSGGPSMSGAKIKAPNKEQQADKAEPAADKEDGSAADKP
jgi:hypothetical protein